MVIQTIADTSKTTRKEVGAKLGHFSLVLLKGSSCNKSIKCSNLKVFSFTSGQNPVFFSDWSFSLQPPVSPSHPLIIMEFSSVKVSKKLFLHEWTER